MAGMQNDAVDAVRNDLQQKLRKCIKPSTTMQLIFVLSALNRGELGPAQELYKEWSAMFSEQDHSFKSLCAHLDFNPNPQNVTSTGGCDGASV